MTHPPEAAKLAAECEDPKDVRIRELTNRLNFFVDENNRLWEESKQERQATADLQSQLTDATQRAERAEAEISEWKCTRCDMIHPAPKVFTAMCCPKCGSAIGPCNYMERRECEAKLQAAEAKVIHLRMRVHEQVMATHEAGSRAGDAIRKSCERLGIELGDRSSPIEQRVMTALHTFQCKLRAAEFKVSGLMGMMIKPWCDGYEVKLPWKNGGYENGRLADEVTFIDANDLMCYWFPDRPSAIAAIELALGERKEGE